MKWIKNKPPLGTFILQSVVGIVIFAVVVVVDLVTKQVTEGMSRVWVIEGVFSLVSRHNTGGAWSLFGDNPVMMNVIKAFTFVFIAAVLVVMFWPDKRKNMFLIVTLSLLGSGALGNLVDRLAYGYVRDFLSIDLIKFPVFNVADIALVAGTIMLAVYIIWNFVVSEMSAKKTKNSQSDEESVKDDKSGDGDK